jgi:hypothetical protein
MAVVVMMLMVMVTEGLWWVSVGGVWAFVLND